ncbi:MAG: DUF2555 domain-containing protein [Cyanobacteria bacterium SBLK]|nr:DUF2555 domain-containing protein [Cyanobacteria bacterium SBLK]
MATKINPKQNLNSNLDITQIAPEDVAQLAERLDRDDYGNPFEALEDWHLLRAIAFHNAELVEPYLYLLDIEAYDEA